MTASSTVSANTTEVRTVRPRGSARRRVASLVRAEFTLLRRNKLMLFNALAMPLIPFAILIPMRNGGNLDDDAVTTVLTLMVSILLLFVVYYNVLSSVVARREELVLKRLRTGECSDLEILAGSTLPSIGIVTAMVVVMATVGTAVGLPLPPHPLVLAATVLGGALVFTTLALLTTVFTRNSEAAQLTSLPLVALCVFAVPGPLAADFLPESVQPLLQFVPMAPIAELATLGWLGRLDGATVTGLSDTLAAAWQPGLVLLGWVVFGIVAVRVYFRWEPRR